MWDFSCFHKVANRPASVLKPLALTVAVLTVGACSSDVTRFDEPGFGLTDSGAANREPRPSRGLTGNGQPLGNASPSSDRYTYADPAPVERPPSSRPTVDTAALPPPNTTPSQDRYTPRQDRYTPRYAPQAREPAREPTSYDRPAEATPTLAPASAAPPRTITIERGDTLYALSRRHGVSVNSLMAENGLTSSTLRPGQVLRLPTGASNSVTAARRPSPTTRQPAASEPSRIVTAAPPTAWTGEYTVEKGDSLYVIARRYDVRVSDLQRYNGITDPRRVRTGTVLKVPGIGDGRSASDPVIVASRDTGSTGRIIDTPPPAATTAATGRRLSRGSPASGISVLNGSGNTQPATQPRVVQSVRVNAPAKARTPIAAPATAKLRWPVNGKVISKFGRRPDGTHNDGINLEVPAGTSVKAADSGEVAYAGSELRGYGNLVLVRHENGWVTAYAHNENLLVKRGDKVARGQVIANAGKTGEVDRPQVHFELRRDAKPVDPLPYLEAL